MHQTKGNYKNQCHLGLEKNYFKKICLMNLIIAAAQEELQHR